MGHAAISFEVDHTTAVVKLTIAALKLGASTPDYGSIEWDVPGSRRLRAPETATGRGTTSPHR